ncbi:MAG TPA: hypothetical protein DCS88_12000 [Alphaproteobacteria bacterium]|nr:hypothetical protein [Alphaproteobacteria bacterium]
MLEVKRICRVKLSDNSRIAIVGGGPAGSMAGFFLMELSQRIDLKIQVDLYEPKDYSRFGPIGCNMCAGVISESLVQTLAAEGIELPSKVVQRGVESYVLHTSGCQSVTIDTRAEEMRIATVYRGSGPQEPMGKLNWRSFDGYLQELAQQHGVRIIRQRVIDLKWNHDRPEVICRGDSGEVYDLLIGAVGVNSSLLKKFETFGFSFQSPGTSKGFLSEIHLGEEQVQKYLGSSMHIFLLDIPGLKFAALIPKVEYVTICLLGEQIDRQLVERFMCSDEVRQCFPSEMKWEADDHHCELGQACHCGPKLNLKPSKHPYADRVVLVGDSVVSRLYKDGIGAAYITAKACAVTALFLGVSAHDFEKHYQPVVQRIARDNIIGGFVFFATALYQKFRFLRRGMVYMVRQERSLPTVRHLMSRVLWDTFTGSASYKEILLRALHPVFLFKIIFSTLLTIFRPSMIRVNERQRERDDHE